MGGLGRGSNPLNSFFPFDPYLLQMSYCQVRPYYRNWEDCVLTIEGGEHDAADKENVKGEEVDSVAFTDDDTYSEVGSLDNEEAAGAEEGESEDDDDDEEDDECHHGYGQIATDKGSAANGPALLQEDDHFEMEIRRSRAMSTGSQCSW